MSDDAIFSSVMRGLGGAPAPPDRDTPPATEPAQDDDTAIYSSAISRVKPESDDDGIFHKALSGLDTVLGAPRRAVMAGARAVGRLEGLDIPESMTPGEATRETLGLSTDPAAGTPGNDTYGRRIAGGIAQLAGDIGYDPTTYALAGASRIAGLGKTASAALEASGRLAPEALGALSPEAAAAAAETAATGRTAANIGRAAAAAFVPGMATSAVHSSTDLYRRLRDEGVSPAAAEDAMIAASTGLFAAGTAMHAAGIGEGHARRIEAEAAKPTGAPVAPEAPGFTVPEEPFNLQERPGLDVYEGPEVPPPVYAPPPPPVDVLAERQFLAPDQEAATNAAQAARAREFAAGRGITADALSEALQAPPGAPRLAPDTGGFPETGRPAPRPAPLPEAPPAPEPAPLFTPKPEDALQTSIQDAMAGRPGAPRLVPTEHQRRDAAELERVGPRMADIPDAELADRERFYRQRGYVATGDAVREEMTKRAEAGTEGGEPSAGIPVRANVPAAPAPEQPTIQAPPTPEVPWRIDPATLKAESAGGRATVEVPVDQLLKLAHEDINRPARSPRDAAGNTDKLTQAAHFLADVAARGETNVVETPEISVRGNRIIVEDGAHRSMAAALAGAETIPVRIDRPQLADLRRLGVPYRDLLTGVTNAGSEAPSSAERAVPGAEPRVAGSRVGGVEAPARRALGEEPTEAPAAAEQVAKASAKPPIKQPWPQDERGQFILPGEEGLTPEQRGTLTDTVYARVHQLAQDQKYQPTGRAPLTDLETGAPLSKPKGGELDYGGDVNVKDRSSASNRSNKRGGPLESIPEGPKEIVDAMRRDKGNALERRVREAVLKGDDELQAHFEGDEGGGPPRYAVRPAPDLSKQVDKLLYKRNADGTYKVSAQLPNGGGGRMIGEAIPEAKLEDNVGKDVAQRIIQGTGKDENLGGPGTTSQPRDVWKSLSGLDLKVGGEGMKGFYDKIIPDAMNRLGKKFGAKVGETEFPAEGKVNTTPNELHAIMEDLPPGSAFTAHSIDVSPEMRRSVTEEGQPLFARGSKGPVGKAGSLDMDQRVDEAERSAVPLSGGRSVANPYSGAVGTIEQLAPRLEPFVGAVNDVVRSISERIGATPKFLGLSTDADFFGVTLGDNKSIRLSLPTIVDEARARVERLHPELVGDEAEARVNRETARLATFKLMHEAAHVKVEAEAAKNPALRKTLDTEGGHGQAFVDTLRRVFSGMGEATSMLRSHLEGKLEGDTGAAVNDLWRASDDEWQQAGHGRYRAEGDVGGAGGSLLRAGREAGREAEGADVGAGDAGGMAGGGEAGGVRPGGDLLRGGGEPVEAGGRAPVRRGGAKVGSTYIPLEPYERPEHGDSSGEAYNAARQAGTEKVRSAEMQKTTSTPEFKRFFGNSKVVDEQGEPMPVYRGDNRADRVGTKFKTNKTTSGRFYFTDDPGVATGYALGKADSHAVDELQNTEDWFRFPPDKGSRTPNNLRTQWWRLDPEQRERVKDTLLKTGTDPETNVFDFSGENPLNSPDHWDYEVKKAGGNWLKAADEVWLQSGSIFGDEERFGDILKHAGLDSTFDSPGVQKPGVTPVFLNIRRPLDTGNIPPEVISNLERVARTDRTRARPFGADAWDKSTITTKDWFESLKEDQAKGTTLAWTRIPEKVTEALQRMGYDGIKDTGGKMGGDKHNVWIAFDPEQIKSAIANRGTYDPTKADIRYATAPAAVPAFIPKNVQQALADLGYSKADRAGMKPDEAQRLVNGNVKKEGFALPEDREFKIGSTTPAGRAPLPDEAPQVEGRVESMRAAEGEPGQEPTELSRDAPRTWESLDPKIQKILRNTPEDVLRGRATRGDLDDAGVQAWSAVVQGKKEAMERAKAAVDNARDGLEDSGTANAKYLSAALDYVAAEGAHIKGGTETARALAARARIMEAGANVPHAFLKKVFREIEGVSDKQATDLLRVFMEDPQSLPDALRATLKPTMLDKFLEFWKSGLVSATGTQLANVSGNALEQAGWLGETLTSAAIDRMLGGERARTGGEARAEITGAGSQVREASRRLWSEVKSTFTLGPEAFDLNKGRFESQVGAIGGKTGRAVRIPFRLLQAADNWFAQVASGAELGKRSFRQAARDLGTSASREAVEARAEAIRANPSKTLLQEVQDASLSRTFHSDPGTLARSVLNARRQSKLLNIIIPFVNTPANIARRTIERSPIGFLLNDARTSYGDYLKAEREFKAGNMSRDAYLDARGKAIDAMSRPVLGTAILGSFAALAQSGGMTGSGPTDPKERNLLRETGWQPYSFVFESGGKKNYIPFNRFEPISSTLGFAADMIEAKDSKKAGDLLDKFLGSVAQNLTSKTWLQGLADAGALISNPGQAAGQYVTGLAGSLVPNIVAKGAQAIDSTVRDVSPSTTGLLGVPEKIGKTIASRIPGLSSTLPARMSSTGEPVERPGNAVTRFALPVQPSEEKEGSGVESLLVNLGYAPAQPSKDFTVPGSNGKKLELAPDEYAVVQQANKRAADYIRQNYMNNPRFRALPPEDQKKAVERIYDQARDSSRQQLYSMSGFRRRASELLSAAQ